MRNIEDLVISKIRDHAERSTPHECCGVVVVRNGRQTYIPIDNVSSNPTNEFQLDPSQFAVAEDHGEVLAIVHSHVGIPSTPSLMDRVECERSGYPWIVVSTVDGSLSYLEPTGFRAPLIGREFIEGTLDCYALVRDYYKEVCRIDLPDFDRKFTWWQNGDDLISRNLESAGFYSIQSDELRKNDGIIMQIGSRVPNHVGVYAGNNMFLHHLKDRLSSRDVYGGYWRHVTTSYVRHRDTP